MADASTFTAVAASAAAGGFLFSIVKNYFDGQRSREISARAAWEKYLVLAFGHPVLAQGVAEGDEKFEEYEWFISLMLYAGEEVLLCTRKDKAWRATLNAQFWHHRHYLGGPTFAQYKSGYSKDLRRVLDEWATERAVSLILAEFAREALKATESSKAVK